MLCQLRARRVYRRDGSVAGQRHANGFAQAVHAVGRIHTRAAAAAGTGVFGVIVQHVFADDAGLVAPHRLEHLGKRNVARALPAREHRPAADDNGRDIQPGRGHQHAGHDLVAVRHQYQAIKPVGARHRLHAVADQLTAGQGILHTDMAHGDSVAHTDGRYQDRSTARHAHARLDSLGQLVQMSMAGYDLAVRAHNADQRTVDFFISITQSIKKTPVRRTFSAFQYGFAVQLHGVPLLFLLFSPPYPMYNRRGTF